MSGGMTRTDGTRGRRALIAVSAVLVAGALVLAGLFLYVRFVGQPSAGDVPSGVACEDLPPRAQVEEALEQQRDVVERLEALGDVEVLAQPCGEAVDGGAQIVVLVPSKAVSDAVQDVLDETPFTVPVSIRNV